MRPLIKKIVPLVLVAGLLVLGFSSAWVVGRHLLGADQTPLADEYGVFDATPSIPTDSEKQIAINRVADAGFGWIRHEFRYENPINFANYDSVQSKAAAKGIKTLGILNFIGKDKSHEDWKNYVQAVVSHYNKDVAAWEVMNEIDNYLSPAEYVTYLKEAHDIIKQNNPGAIIVLSGITSRPEAVNFWDGVAAAGGWDSFDALGLHHYHRQNPEKVNFGGGDLVAELSRPLATIQKNGNSKKIWVTEIGYIDNAGVANQANWLARNLLMAKSIPAVEKIFIYRLSNKDADFRYGITDSNLTPLPVYNVVKETINRLRGKPTGERLHPEARAEVENFENLDGWSTPDKKNATADLSLGGGVAGQGLKIDYTFSDSSAYAVASKTINLGTPQAIGAWFYGDDANNVWKFRFTDRKGETYQTDLGAIPAGWSYKQFVLGYDSAIVSWGGDNTIDYPITFSGIVVDHQGGKASGSVRVDELTTVAERADLFAYQYSDLVAYWKGADSQSGSLCGQTVEFKEAPQYIVAGNCVTSPTLALPLASPSPQPSPVAKPSPSPSPLPNPSPSPTPSLPLINADKSELNIVGQDVPADGQSSYTMTIILRDQQGQVVTNIKPSVVTDPVPTTTVEAPVLNGANWQSKIASLSPGSQNVVVVANGQTIKSTSLAFLPILPETVVPPLPWYVRFYLQLKHPYLFFGWVAGLLAVALYLIFLGVEKLDLAGAKQSTSQAGLTTYVKAQLSAGVAETELRALLLRTGWSDQAITQAILAAHVER